jgi:hypothetical protein
MLDPRQFGKDLAERMVGRLRCQDDTATHVMHGLAGDLALHANAMAAQGMSRQEVANWVRAVEAAFGQYLDQMLIEAAEAVEEE